MNYQLISAIFRHPWAIYEQSALGYGPLISNMLSGSPIVIEGTDEKPFYIGASVGKPVPYFELDEAPAGSVAVIPLSGPLMKNDQLCGPRGMATWGQRIREADQHENINAIILKIDSPGGTVDGTEALAEIVKNTTKPVISYIDGLMASAALWIGIQADEIIASSDTDEVGSVGVLLSFADVQPYYERLGLKFHQIVSNHSKDKTEWLNRLLKGDYDEYKKEVLDPLAEKFQNVVRAARPGVKDDHMSGKIYFARDVIGVFVDSIGNFDAALARAFQLGKKSNTTNTTMSKSKETQEYTATMEVIGVESLESNKEGIFLNEEQMDAIEAAIKEGSQAKTDLDEEKKRTEGLEEGQTITSLQEQANKAKGLEEGETVASIKEENKQLKDQNEELSRESKEEETVAKTRADDAGASKDEEANKYFKLSVALKN